MNIKESIAEKLLQIKAIKLNPQNPFTWASGIKSPIYCDNRVTLSFPEARMLVKNSFIELSKHFGEFDYVAGVATAGIAHGVLLAEALDKPFVYVRAEAKSHGRQNKIEGYIPQGSSALVIEDLISTGGSSIKACEALQDENISVVGVMAIFDYQFDVAKNNFAKHKIEYQTLSDYSTMIGLAASSNYIDKEQIDLLSKWNRNPEEWYAENF